MSDRRGALILLGKVHRKYGNSRRGFEILQNGLPSNFHSASPTSFIYQPLSHYSRHPKTRPLHEGRVEETLTISREKTRPSILCVTHQMSRKREIIQLAELCLTRWWIISGTWWYWDSMWWYWLVLGQYKLVLLGIRWYMVSKGLVCLYILEKVEIWSGDTDAWQTHRQQNIGLLSFSIV